MYSLDANNSLSPRVNTIENVTGACLEASQQNWSCGNELTLSLRRAFPVNATVDLIFEVSEWADGKELEFSLGDSSFVGKFEQGLSSALLRFTNSAPSEYLTIRVVSPGAEELSSPPQLVRPIWGYSTPSH